MRLVLLFVAFLCAHAALAQTAGQAVLDPTTTRHQPPWEHTSLGRAGEPFVAADGNGHVYVAAHLYNGVSGQGVFYASADSGRTFPNSRVFTNACCDFQVRSGPDERVYVIYMTSAINGLMCAVSDNYGQSFYQNTQVLTGPYDREWFDFRDGGIDIVYSDGYIGGPTSKGIIYSRSDNFGATFSGYDRVDDADPGTQAVDPSIICNDTTMLVGWNTSNDSNTVHQFQVARSTDGGQSFIDHTTIATYDNTVGDTQERWLAQIPLAAAPDDTFFAIYQNYAMVDVDGQPKKALLVFYRRSRDGGHTWEPARTVAPIDDIRDAIRQYESTKWTTNPNIFPYYIQHQPWATLDGKGNVHVVWYDNRSGQNPNVLNTYWRVYHTQSRYEENTWHTPDPVSPEPFLCVRPNLDFISVAADDKYVYCAWVRRINQTSQSWSFYGDLFLSRRRISAFRPVGP